MPLPSSHLREASLGLPFLFARTPKHLVLSGPSRISHLATVSLRGEQFLSFSLSYRLVANFHRIGAGKYTQPGNPIVQKCKRMTGSYPTQVKGLFPRIDDKNFLFESCSGDKLENLDSQLSNLDGTHVQVVTLSISGNDFKFSDVVKDCVYNVLPSKTDAEANAECDASLAEAASLIADETIWTTYKNKVNDIMGKVMIQDITGIPSKNFVNSSFTPIDEKSY